ncbi:M56 family metallopeptidase [Anaerolentibacter hominis]|uniref:M56 family metallopeptidase n=1 Tax=Anaerolentibacter hominis TaxID=3079009 RepID=UPI0031B80175
MLKTLFLHVLSVSLGAVPVILLLCCTSGWITRHYKAGLKYWIWLILSIRLLLPVDGAITPSQVEVTIQDTVLNERGPSESSVILNSELADRPETAGRFHPGQVTVLDAAAAIWAAGMSLYWACNFLGYEICKRRIIKRSRRVENERILGILKEEQERYGIKQNVTVICDKKAESPFVMGFFRSLLILPGEDYPEQQLRYILRHELIHYRRRDIWYKLLLLTVKAVHWFNPIMWIMTGEAQKDLELSCDSAVVADAGQDERLAYGEAILSGIRQHKTNCSSLSTCFNGGVQTMKKRLRNLMRPGKKKGVTFGISILTAGFIMMSLVACAAVTAPGNTDQDSGKTSDITLVGGVEPPNQSEPSEPAEPVQNSPQDQKKEDFVTTAQGFASAYFSNDLESLLTFMPPGADGECYGEDILGRIHDLSLKYDESALEDKTVITAQYEFRLDDEDSFTYLGLEMEYKDGTWLVTSGYLEK